MGCGSSQNVTIYPKGEVTFQCLRARGLNFTNWGFNIACTAFSFNEKGVAVKSGESELGLHQERREWAFSSCTLGLPGHFFPEANSCLSKHLHWDPCVSTRERRTSSSSCFPCSGLDPLLNHRLLRIHGKRVPWLLVLHKYPQSPPP